MVETKVLLILPPSTSAIKEILGITSPPLGLAYIASFLEKEGNDVKIIDSLAENFDLHRIDREIGRWNPDMVGVTSTTPNFYDALKVAKIAKMHDCRVVMGGPHVTFMDIETLEKTPFVDYIIRGEGEITMHELVKSLEKGIEPKRVTGLTYKSKGIIKRNPPKTPIKNLDSLPMPAYHLLPMEKYVSEGLRYATVISSRGCPFGCVFCSSSRICGKRWRARSTEKVVEEVQLLRDKYKVQSIEFVDDNFTLNRKRVKDICEEFVRRGIDVFWVCGSRVDSVNSELLSNLSKANCLLIYLGVESGSQRILDYMMKGVTLSQSERTVKLAKRYGLEVAASFILGMPDETVSEIEDTIKFAIKLNPEFAQFTIATPYPGTKLYDYALENNLLITRDWSKYDTLTPVMRTVIGVKRLVKLFRKAYFKFYGRIGYVVLQIRKRRLIIASKFFKVIKNYLRTSLT